MSVSYHSPNVRIAHGCTGCSVAACTGGGREGGGEREKGGEGFSRDEVGERDKKPRPFTIMM